MSAALFPRPVDRRPIFGRCGWPKPATTAKWPQSYTRLPFGGGRPNRPPPEVWFGQVETLREFAFSRHCAPPRCQLSSKHSIRAVEHPVRWRTHSPRARRRPHKPAPYRPDRSPPGGGCEAPWEIAGRSSLRPAFVVRFFGQLVPRHQRLGRPIALLGTRRWSQVRRSLHISSRDAGAEPRQSDHGEAENHQRCQCCQNLGPRRTVEPPDQRQFLLSPSGRLKHDHPRQNCRHGSANSPLAERADSFGRAHHDSSSRGFCLSRASSLRIKSALVSSTCLGAAIWISA